MDPARTKRRILVVDDDDDLRETICDVLALAGHDVVQAADGRAALAQLRARRFDLIVTDLQMPGMDGWELLAALQTDWRLRHTPVCVVSAEADVPRRASTRFIRKPFELASLVRIIDEVLGRACFHRCAA
jgi:two-component system chemotaxis response regulator CheY